MKGNVSQKRAFPIVENALYDIKIQQLNFDSKITIYNQLKALSLLLWRQ